MLAKVMSISFFKDTYPIFNDLPYFGGYDTINFSSADGFPSGQRGQTVNLLTTSSKVRILLHPLCSIYYLSYIK